MMKHLIILLMLLIKLIINLNDEELEEAGKLLQIVKDNYQKIIELIVQL